MFPVTIGGVTYALSDFSPLGYIDALPDSIGSCFDAISQAVSATSSTAATVGTGGVPFTVATGLTFALGEHVTVARTSNPTVTVMEGAVASYDSGTGALLVTVYKATGSGTHSDWTISPSLYGRGFLSGLFSRSGPFPILFSQGGVGGWEDRHALKVEAGMGFPEFTMQRVFEDFQEPLGPPWYTATSTATGTASLAVVSLAGSDVAVTSHPGALYLEATGTTGISEREEPPCAYASFGQYGFMNANTGGPIEFECGYRPTHLPETEVYVTRMGLRGDGNSETGNCLDLYGLGFEVGTGLEGGYIAAVLAQAGVVQKTNTGVYPSTSAYRKLKILVDTSNSEAKWYVDGVLVMEASISGIPSTVEALLHPAFSHSTSSTSSRGAYIDYLYCTQRVNRT